MNLHKDAMIDEQCAKWRRSAVLFAAGDELDVVEQSELAAHLAICSPCRVELESERELLALLAEQRAEPDSVLLASCRANLEDALDREEEGGWLRRKIGWLLPADWWSPRPAWSAALLVMIGFSVGMFGPQLLRHPAARASAVRPAIESAAGASSVIEPAASPSASSSTFDLHTADVAGINVLPADGNDPPQVELRMKAQQPVTVQGTVDDDNVKRVLLYVLRNNQRFGPDVRLNAVDLLRPRSGDPDVRSALCRAVETDHNAGVRLKALEALNGAASQDMVRHTLLDALQDDQNPGVRVEAINSLRQMAESGQIDSDDRVLAVLRDRMDHDPNTYIRLQSAAAIQDLSSH
jgi:HEAT repeats